MNYSKNNIIYCLVLEKHALEHALEGELSFVGWIAVAAECSTFAHLPLLSLFRCLLVF